MQTKSTQGVLLNLVIYRGRNLTVILTEAATAAAAACSKFKGFVLSPKIGSQFDSTIQYLSEDLVNGLS